jgi:hypothetical protein
VSTNEDRRRAGDWLDRHYPMDHTRPPYDPDAAINLLGLRELGVQHDDIIAWVYPSRDAAEHYARANAAHWGHPSLGIAVDANGEIVGVTDLRPALAELGTARHRLPGDRPADTPAPGATPAAGQPGPTMGTGISGSAPQAGSG